MNNNQSQNDKYQSVQVTQPNFNSFNLSCHHVTTCDYFRLQPIYTRDMVPGDTFNVNIDALVQASPFVQPVFGGYHVDIDFFFVPNRIIYKDWDNFITDTSDNYTPPYANAPVVVRDMSSGTLNLFSSIGYPFRDAFGGVSSMNVSRLPARAYQRIWWDYYRDSLNILERDKSAYLNTDGGNTGNYDFIPRYRCFQKDYISTLLPSPQFGKSASAEIRQDGFQSGNIQANQLVGSTYLNPPYLGINSTSGNLDRWLQSVSVPALRAANAMQRYLERLGVGGSRVTERILSIFGQQTSPERLDMAEYCGRKVIRCGVDGNSVTNNNILGLAGADPFGACSAGDDNEYYVGSQFGTSRNRGMSDTISYHAVEHGIFMAVASIVPDITPLSGIDRMFLRGVPDSSRLDAKRLDYYTPDFDGLGYQEVFLKEVVTPNGNSLPVWRDSFLPNQIVGYQPKFEDYRIGRNLISGDFLNPLTQEGYKNMLFFRDLTAELEPDDVVAGLALTTASEATRAEFDNKHQVTSTDYDHFVFDITIVNDATRPMSGNELPTELANLANKTLQDVSYGGVRL